VLKIGTNHWWSNWGASHGYVCGQVIYPQSVQEIAAAIFYQPIHQRHPPHVPVKAVGGGWSFTDASLPFQSQADVDAVSIQKMGANATENLTGIIQVLSGNQTTQPMDLTPEKVDQALDVTTYYNQSTTTLESNLSGLSSINIDWPVPNPTIEQFLSPKSNVRLIDIGGLASSLQQQFPNILSSTAQSAMKSGVNYFHVEAGITMADLDQLLDHQKPRLAVRSSGGSPGATLAGTLSTATHGGEFQWPLLVDTVRAIHLVGPTGEQWWIEGAKSIADPALLNQVYPELDAQHFIGGAWNGIPGLTAQDVLAAVIVSMGTMGVIYSVVLEVVPQYGLQQKVKATTWGQILAATGISNIQTALQGYDPNANQAVLDVLLDGTLNGTGIPRKQNVYADLAINPYTQECWITNRQVTPALPLNPNSIPAGYTDYLSAIMKSLGRRGTNSVFGSSALGRIFDFFGWATDITNPDDLGNDILEAKGLADYVTKWPDTLTATVSTINFQAVANEKATSLSGGDKANRGHLFLADFLTGCLNAIQGTEIENQFDNLVSAGSLFWTANFNGAAAVGDQILFYHPPDGTWWLGTFTGGLITWGLASNTTSGLHNFGDLTQAGRRLWTGNFSGGGDGQVLFYNPGDGNWWIGTFTGGSITWATVSNTSLQSPNPNTRFDNLVSAGSLFWTGDFEGGGSDQILFYHPPDGTWWLGTFGGGSITWGLASNTTSGSSNFGDLTQAGRRLWTGDFSGGGSDQILFYNPGDGNWWLGTFTGGSITWATVSNTSLQSPNPNTRFDDLVSAGSLFWTAYFNGGAGAGDQILFYHPPDGAWWLGTFAGGSISWGLASTTTSGSNNFGDLTQAGRRLWAGDFSGGGSDQILFYNPGDGNWWLGTFTGGSISWVIVSNTSLQSPNPNTQFEDLVSAGSLFWTANFNGGAGAGDQILFYHPPDGAWWLGTFASGSISWSLASNTTAGDNKISDQTGISYKVGAIGWPDGGIPGRALEIALAPTMAFSFLQNDLFDDILQNTMIGGVKPLLGYISVRVCPTTSTLFGMQQFSRHSIMIEIVGYRSPESDVLMYQIQQKVLYLNRTDLNAMLHWGLETDQMSSTDLLNTPLNNTLRPSSTITKIEAFKTVRKFFLGQNKFNPFDNNFTKRLGL
jgi:hypothetical protein